MKLYLDRLNGLWKYEESSDPHEQKHYWTLISRSIEHKELDFCINGIYNDESVRELAPFKQLYKTTEYVFPPLPLQRGDQVTIGRSP